MGADENWAVLQKLADSINDKTFEEVVPAFVSPNFVRYDLASLWEGVVGQSGAADFLNMLVDAMPDLSIEAQVNFATDEYAAVVWRFHGTHSGAELLGVDATGRHLDVRTVNLYRFEDGKVAETWQMPDAAGLMRQLGLIG